MNRCKFYEKVVVRGNEELDFLNHTLSSFEVKHDSFVYMTNISEVARPDLVSWENFDTVSWWWIVCLINGIENPLTDITVGMKIRIPSKLDVNAFQRKYKLR